MQSRHQELRPFVNALNRREFLSSLAIASGLLVLGSCPSMLATEAVPTTPESSERKDVYTIRTFSEQEILQTYIHILEDACQHADKDWNNSSFDPTAGYWGDGISGGNQGIRSIVSMALACAALIKYSDSLTDGDRGELIDKATAGLRYAAATHRTGTQNCTDGKQWGATDNFGPGSWQSGMWTGTLAFGAWLMWDKLDLALQQSIQRLVAAESDILSRRQPPNGLWLDTKAEENGWEIPCLVLAELMFPSHPHAATWHETAVKYMMNTLCTEADTRDATLVDGRPVNQWVGGANLQPDFTLENHGRFHPSYVGCSCYFLTQASMYYSFAGHSIPQAATHNLMGTWK